MIYLSVAKQSQKQLNLCDFLYLPFYSLIHIKDTYIIIPHVTS